MMSAILLVCIEQHKVVVSTRVSDIRPLDAKRRHLSVPIVILTGFIILNIAITLLHEEFLAIFLFCEISDFVKSKLFILHSNEDYLLLNIANTV